MDLNFARATIKLIRVNPIGFLSDRKKRRYNSDDVLIGILSPYYADNIKTILNELNNGNPFDFEYKPEDNDMLELNFDEDTFSLIYKKDKWEELPYELESLEENEKELLLEGNMKAKLRATYDKP